MARTPSPITCLIRAIPIAVALATTPELASAQCPIAVAPVTVTFVNGIWTSQESAEQSSVEIERLVKADPRWLDVLQDCVDFSFSWNRPDLGGSLDLLTALRQYVTVSSSELVRVIGGLASPNSALNNAMLTVSRQIDAGVICSGSTSDCAVLKRDTSSRAITVAVAHSQGNLYWNEVYRQLQLEVPPVDTRRLRTVAVATPSGTALGPYVNIGTDPVAILSGLSPNAANPNCFPFFFGCHLFASSYLAAQDPRQQILDGVFAELPMRIDDSLPVAVDDSYAMLEGDLLDPFGASGILHNDTVPSNFVSVTYLNPPPGFSDNGGGRFTYMPPAGVVGLVQFSYSLHTATTDSLPATISILVNQRPVVPVARADTYTVTQGGQLDIVAPGVLANDTFPPGATVEFLAPLHPALRAGNPDGSFTLDLSTDPLLVGPVALQYVIHSMNGDSNVASVTVQVTPTVTNQATRLGWDVSPTGDILAMQVPPWMAGTANFGWQFMMSRRGSSVSEWGTNTCFGGAGGGYPVNLFQTSTDFIAYNGGMNVFGLTGQDTVTRGGIGTSGCVTPGNYYFELSDLSSRQPDGGFSISYFYELMFDGTTVSPVGDGVATQLPVTIAPDGVVTFSCSADYTNVGYESLSGQFPDTSLPVSTNTLGPIFNCNALGASTYTMEGGFLNETRVTPDGDYWVRLSKYGTTFSVTSFNREWVYWKARRQGGVWSVIP